MARWVHTLLLAVLLAASSNAEQKPKPPPAPEEELPEEDETVKETVYAFNPLQSSKEMQVGNYYWKKGSYRAALQRYREATRWNPGNADAWFRLGETAEKLKDRKVIKEAYSKYLELAPEGKNADEIRKKIK